MIKKIYQDSTFYLIIFILSYFFYIYPIEILNEFIFNENINRHTTLYYSFIISILVIFYFKSKNTFIALKIFVYEGIGVGFISFWIINISLLVDFFFNYERKIIGILSIIIIFLLSIIGFI